VGERRTRAAAQIGQPGEQLADLRSQFRITELGRGVDAGVHLQDAPFGFYDVGADAREHPLQVGERQSAPARGSSGLVPTAVTGAA